jgi:uncharacterized protein
MSYGQPGQGPPYGPPYGSPQGPPDGQPAYGQGAPPPPPYAPQPTRQDMPQRPPQQYAPPQHPAPPGKGRPPRRREDREPAPYGPPGAYTGVPAPGRAPSPERPERPSSGPVSTEDERWAVPAYVGMFVSGFVAPAIVLFVKGRTSDFARFHAAQALNLFVVIFIGTFVSLLLAYLKGVAWLPLVFLVLAADCFVTVWAAIRANRCEWYRLPAIVAPRIFR